MGEAPRVQTSGSLAVIPFLEPVFLGRQMESAGLWQTDDSAVQSTNGIV
jgi:hypothetical protein